MVERTPGPYVLSEVDGTTIFSRNRHTGVCACGPDPLCREHYRGGSVGGHHFGPPASVAEQQANARFVFEAITRYDELLLVVKDYMQLHPAFRVKPEGAPHSAVRQLQDEHVALEKRAHDIIERLKGKGG